MRAGTRRPSPCRASIGRAQEDQGISTGQAHGSAAGGGRRRAGYGTAERARRVSLRGGPTLPRKIMPGVDIVPTRAGLVIGLMVTLSGPLFTDRKR
ncbi:MAG: hypothetical protein WC502_05930 [Methanolinea sp.]